jgi:NADH-quinone oxidoreductase subunit G
MATIIIDGQNYELPEGAKFNAIQAARHFGIEIPYYCWHPALSVVANCRMCEIEVGSKDASGEIKMLPRLTPGCQTPVRDGTVLVTDSSKVLEHRKNIMELLLINHPLDCPVCDQAGECGLQDYSYSHGRAEHRFVEERNVKPKKDVSDLIVLNTDRCIMCTRCVRFTREITGTAELQIMRRGDHGEIAIFPDQPLDNPLAGNVVDLCPVGALLDKDFLHNQRVWFLSKHDTVCTGCSTGCNISSEENAGKVWRHKPRHNPYVNDYWICDEGRYGYKAANAPDLLAGNYILDAGDHHGVATDRFFKRLNEDLTHRILDKQAVLAIFSPFLSVEEAYSAATWVKHLTNRSKMALGPVPVVGQDQTFAPDKITGRSGDTSFLMPRPFTISAEKVPNKIGRAHV